MYAIYNHTHFILLQKHFYTVTNVIVLKCTINVHCAEFFSALIVFSCFICCTSYKAVCV